MISVNHSCYNSKNSGNSNREDDSNTNNICIITMIAVKRIRTGKTLTNMHLTTLSPCLNEAAAGEKKP